MSRGGKITKNRADIYFHFIEIFLPIILLSYGFLMQINIIDSSRPTSIIALYLFAFGWATICIFNIIKSTKTNGELKLRLILSHILLGLYLVFISSIAIPTSLSWLLLMIVSYIKFKEKGLLISTLSFLVVVVMDIILWFDVDNNVLVHDLIILVIVFVAGMISLISIHSRNVSREELEQSKAEELLQKDRVLTIINNMTDAVIVVDIKGTVSIYNAATLNLLDTNVDLAGKNICNILRLSDQDSKKINILNEFKSAKTVINRDDLNYIYSDREVIRVEMTYSPIRRSYSRSKKSEIVDGYVLIMRDITKAKSLEEERDEFISVTSHELRTPITIAEGTLSNLQLMISRPGLTTQMIKDGVDTAHDQVIFLANMVNDLSTLSRAERGVADEAEIIDVEELAHKLFEKYSVEAKSKKLHLDLDLAPGLGKVMASRLYLEELLQNFITNSLKYTKEGGIKIIFTQKNGMIDFAIKDTGIGISKSDKQKVFQKFYRSEDYRTRETGGTGLGLYIAAKLARKLGTQIQVVSRLNFGSTFSFMLPKSVEN